MIFVILGLAGLSEARDHEIESILESKNEFLSPRTTTTEEKEAISKNHGSGKYSNLKYTSTFSNIPSVLPTLRVFSPSVLRNIWLELLNVGF